MTREEIRANILGIKNNYILAELPTSLGKSKIALDFMADRNIKGNILIVIPKLVLIDNWKREFVKWGYKPFLKQVTFSTYVSLPKHTNTTFELVIFDECHHLSERARAAVENFTSQYYILLSATVTKTLKKEIQLLFPGIECCKISMREAIEDDILPDPKVFLIPLQLNDKKATETMIINKGAKGKAVPIAFKDRFAARKNKSVKYSIQCTQAQYHQDLCSMVDYYKNQYMRTNNQIIFFRWQQKALERLKWLSSLKNDVVKDILKKLKNKRTLTFCNSIEQTEKLGKYCINSKNKDSSANLEKFNNGEINHITACSMLNEGVNLANCQVGIFVSINSSEIMVKQKNGRILRHAQPIIIILYYKDTREEELVREMLQNYNRELITVVTNIKNIEVDDCKSNNKRRGL